MSTWMHDERNAQPYDHYEKGNHHHPQAAACPARPARRSRTLPPVPASRRRTAPKPGHATAIPTMGSCARGQGVRLGDRRHHATAIPAMGSCAWVASLATVSIPEQVLIAQDAHDAGVMWSEQAVQVFTWNVTPRPALAPCRIWRCKSAASGEAGSRTRC